jgi:hypothetical protein
LPLTSEELERCTSWYEDYQNGKICGYEAQENIPIKEVVEKAWSKEMQTNITGLASVGFSSLLPHIFC